MDILVYGLIDGYRKIYLPIHPQRVKLPFVYIYIYIYLQLSVDRSHQYYMIDINLCSYVKCN